MSLDMVTKVRITSEVSKRYRKASKKEKGRILDEFCATTEYNRKYVGRVLRRGPCKKGGKSPPRRPRPYRKNDGCYVEQKNYTSVIRNVGYMRYDTDEELELLNRLYDVLRLYGNFFLPQMKLIEKTREGSKVKKRYEEPKTPYRRLLESPDVDQLTKRKLKRQYAKLNPAELKRQILDLQDKIYERAVFKGGKEETPDECDVQVGCIN